MNTEPVALVTSWWECRPELFAERCRQEQARMQLSPFGRMKVLATASFTKDYDVTRGVGKTLFEDAQR